MKIRVDAEVCTGHGRCYVLGPDVFAADEYGHCELIHGEVDGGELERQARVGADNCPERAITLS